METSKTNRRTFLRRGAVGAGGVWIASLQEFAGKRALAAPADVGQSPYGSVSPVADEVTGLPLLQLPEGFRYSSYSWTGDIMSDGVACPSLHDGMAVVDEWYGHGRGDGVDNQADRTTRAGRLILVRNHEVGLGTPYVDNPLITYANDGGGGNTNLIFNPRSGLWESDWSTLAGTVRNCAGGVTPWATWISSEETGEPGHGWNFEVGSETGDPAPLVDMGRFSHEAVMVDPRTGYVYETEDSGDCGFYKFVPNRRARLALGGRLYMLKVKNEFNADLGQSYPIGTTWDVQWVRIGDPAAATMSVFQQGFAKGAAKFQRLEGAWWGGHTGFFLSTNGGVVGEGQVFEYDPRAETLKLIYDSPTAEELDNPDNITVTPRGGLLLCEDAAPDHVFGERLIGLTLNGETFTFAVNNIVLTAEDIANAGKRVNPGDYRTQEWAGATYSPDGDWLFVNIQTPGITFAITGPWGDGPL